MYHKQLVTHVAAKIEAGLSNEDIWKELSRDGWSDRDIADAFYYISHPEKLERFSFKRLFISEIPIGVALVACVLVVAGIGGYTYAFSSTTLNYQIILPGALPEQPVELQYGEQPALSDPDFFGRTKQQFIGNKANFIEADLSAMRLRVYTRGSVALEVPIVTKGRPGSWWETPAGLYRIETKDKARFSGMGQVWMPYAMEFQGNFFIHGHTYYPNGILTSNSFTGGCIRLSTEDAKRVFDAVEIGTPVLVFEKGLAPDSFSYNSEPAVAAPAYLAVDIKNNHVFASKGATEIIPIASITKLLTALVAAEYINLDRIATVPEGAIVYTSKPRLTPGMSFSVYRLLFPLLVESSNEAAETIARFYGRDEFIKHMNEKAGAIGMAKSRFVDPSGVSKDNVSTAEDLFALARYLYINRSFIFGITAGRISNSAYGTSGFTDLGNFNDFIGNQYFFGGKNGQTVAANETNLSVFELPVGDTKRPVAIIVLGSANAKKDAGDLLDFVLMHFK